MSNSEKKSGSFIAIATMFALYGMVGFVTFMAAPVGAIWKEQPGIAGSNMLATMGVTMNFMAYLFMGIPSGMLLSKIGYKKTSLAAIAAGCIGVLIQTASGYVPGSLTIGTLPTAWFVYLLGAFISGFSMCMLNTVICPMLNTLGGARGNQLNLAGGTFQSICTTLAPILLGGIVGAVTAETKITDISGVLFTAAAVFAIAFIIISFLPIKDPEQVATADTGDGLPLTSRHCLMGIFGIFLYMGIEAGVGTGMNLWLSDANSSPLLALGNDPTKLAAIAGSAFGAFCFLMLVGRFIGSAIGGKVTPRMLLLATAGLGVVFVALGMALSKVGYGIPFGVGTLPISAFFFIACGLCASVMWATIFNLSVDGLGKNTEKASGLFMEMVIGGALLPLVQNFIADKAGFVVSFIVPLLCFAYLFVYALAFTRKTK